MAWQKSRRLGTNVALALLVSLSLVLAGSSGATASPITATLAASLADGPRDIVVAGSKLYVLNASNIKVVDTSVSPAAVTTVAGLDAIVGGLTRGVYLPSDQSLWVVTHETADGEVIRIDTTTNAVTHRFTGGAGSLQRKILGSNGIVAAGGKVYVTLNRASEEDGIAVFDATNKTRLDDLAYTVVSIGTRTDGPWELAVLGDHLYVFQGTNPNVVQYNLSTNAQTTLGTGIATATQFVATDPGSTAIYFGRETELRRLTESGGAVTFANVRTGLIAARDVAFTPVGHNDGNWLFIARSGGVTALRADNFAEVGTLTVSGGATGIAVANAGQSLFVASPPSINQISLNPAVTPTNASLTLNTAGTVSAPTISGFWKTVAYESTALPVGLELDPATGVISGTPTVAGTTNVTVTATNETMFTRSSNFSITVVDPDAPPPSPPASGGVAVSKPAVPELAATGSSVNGLGQLGLVAIAAGATLALVARRLALGNAAKTGS